MSVMTQRGGGGGGGYVERAPGGGSHRRHDCGHTLGGQGVGAVVVIGVHVNGIDAGDRGVGGDLRRRQRQRGVFAALPRSVQARLE